MKTHAGLPRLSETEVLILSALAGQERYGLQIVDEVQRITRGKRRISLGGLYTTLRRMESKSIISARWGDTTEDRRGARRRYYRVTALGERALREEAAVLAGALRVVAPSLGL